MLLDLLKSTINPPKLTTSVFDEKYIDIHSHILPFLDDGANSFDQAIEMLCRMKELGIRNFVFTPHVMQDVWENSTENILQKFKEFQSKTLEIPEFTDIQIRIAAEYTLDENFLNLLQKNDILTLKDNKILIELPSMEMPLNLFDFIEVIQDKGFVPILAHPERYLGFHQNEGIYCKLKSAGCLFQVSLLSLSDNYNRDIQNTALWLIRNNLIDFISTDVHRVYQIEVLKKMLQKFGLIELIKPLIKNNRLLL